MQTHLIFDLGGTLIFDPFEDAIAQFAFAPLRQELRKGIHEEAIVDFLNQWRAENSSYNFPFASHFLQEESWITRAAWPAYEQGKVFDAKTFPIWVAETLRLYREAALNAVRAQDHLGELRVALQAALDRGYQLSVASNDRYFATAAMLEAADIFRLFDFVVTSEELSFRVAGAEKPSIVFFKALERRTGLQFDKFNTLYIGDDETRDIISTKTLPLRTIRFFGNRSKSKAWLDNGCRTEANFSFERYSEFSEMIRAGVLERI